MSILEFSNLKYTYNGGKSILRGVSGKLEQGKLYAILGSSGCGPMPISMKASRR